MGLFNFWKKDKKIQKDSTYWISTKYRDRVTGEHTDKWRMENLVYRDFHKGMPSRIKLYADGELVFDGRFKELTDIVKEYNNKTN